MLKRLIAGAALLAIAAPLAAQNAPPTNPPTQPGTKEDPGTPRAPLPTDRGYDKPQVRTEAINAPNRGETKAANSATSGSSASAATIQADLQAQYNADMAAWLDAMRSRDARIAANAAQYDRQQRAYADAMYVWRMQVRDCERGFTFACNRPTPNPADFMR
ncbi:MAG TPA: hypothetical protein VE567_01690 [Sphingomonas sp.]|nr:hypothetical protein [Sphingomonas sp.]